MRVGRVRRSQVILSGINPVLYVSVYCILKHLMFRGHLREHQILVRINSLKEGGKLGIIKSIQDTQIQMKNLEVAHLLCLLEDHKDLVLLKLILRNKEFRNFSIKQKS